MIHTDMKQAILDFYESEFGYAFTGDLKVERVDDCYKVSFYLHGTENPIVIMSDLPKNKFMQYLKTELSKKQLHRVKSYKLNKCYD